MSNKDGLLITNNNIYGIVNPPPKPTRRDRATRYQDVSSAAVRWDVFVDFSNNFVGGGGGGGSGSVNSGKYGEDANGNFIDVTPPTKRDISGIYFDTNKFDVSFNTVSGKENIYVGLKSSGTSLTQDYIDEMFFDPPKAITNEIIELQTTTPPRLDASWNNPTQRRVAFDFLGTLGPKADITGLVLLNDESRDDYNFLPYHQGLKIQYICYDQNGVVSGNDWTTVPVGNLLTSLPTSSGVSYWNNTNGENFLPRFIRKVIIYAEASSSQISPNPSNGIVIFPDAVLTSPFTVDDSSSYAFSLPQYVPGTSSVGTAGKKIQLRVAMINRARASITDPSYNTGHGLSSQDVSWNWVYMPDISGINLGNYGAPTAPLTFITPTTPLHDIFTLSGRNDNGGNGIVNTANSIVETGLSTPFSSLINPPINSSLPKVQYRYDLSGHRLSNSKQVDGNTTDIDLSRNIPDGLPSVWFPSTTNANTVPNTWSDTITRAENKVFPEHKYDIYGYSMRHSLDPSGLANPNNYTDASNSAVVDNISDWNTPIPPRSAATKTDANNGYLETLPDNEDTTIWQETTSSSWTQTNYFVPAGAIKAFLTTGGTKTNLLFLNNGLDPAKNIATTIQSNSSYDVKIRANSDDLLGIDASGVEIIRMRSNIFFDGTTTSHTTDLDLSGVQMGFQGTQDLSGGYSLGAKGLDVSNNFLGWKTSDIVNAFDNGNITQEGGYYCGTELSDIDISNVNLTTYRDISNNTSQAGYKVIIYQELSGNSANWTRHPTAIGEGWNKIFNIATRPIEDITLSTTNSDFEIMDGYNGSPFASYNNSNNKFKFGAEPKGENPTANFFGLPILAKTSTNIVEYTISLENLDATWWPTDGNLIENLEFFIQDSGSGTAPGPSNYINWSNQSITKVWDVPSSAASPYPNVAATPNTTQDLTGTFNLSGDTGTKDFGVDNNKYSRNLLPTTYSSSVSQPLFFIQGSYCNNILRLKRNNSNSLETGAKRTLDDRFTGDVSKNRFEGNGVGPNGNYTLFWDYTFDSDVSLNKVGDVNSSSTYFNQYPFVDSGQAPDYTQLYDHNVLLHDGTTAATGAERQLMWAADGFKAGNGSGNKNPYVDYNSNYWFGDRSGTRTPNYNPLRILGETLSLTARTFQDTNSGGQFGWWDGDGGFIMNSNLKYKFIVIKCPIPAMTLPSGGFTGVTISTKNAGSTTFDTLPIDNSANLFSGAGFASNPICWWQEFGTTSTHPTSLSNQSPKTGWKATHKTFNPGISTKLNNDNGAGSLWTDGLSSNKKIHRIYGIVGAAGAFDIYFRIGLPNQGTYSIKEVEVQFKYISSSLSVTNVTGTDNKQTFSFFKT